MKRLVMLCLLVLLAVPTFAGAPRNGELTFSADLFKPKSGGTSWSATGEYLIPLGAGPFLLGPSLTMFHGGGFDGGAFGLASEVNFGRTCGPGFGGAVHKPIGDSADFVDYTGEARVFFKCGSEHAFVKFTGAQVWTRQADGSTTDPDGTSVSGALGWRF